MNNKIRKAHLTYLGSCQDKKEPQNKQFTVEITGEEYNRIKQFPFPNTFKGKVVQAGIKSKKFPGEESNNFCNPFNDFYRFYYACWKIQTCICEGEFHNDSCPLRVK